MVAISQLPMATPSPAILRSRSPTRCGSVFRVRRLSTLDMRSRIGSPECVADQPLRMMRDASLHQRHSTRVGDDSGPIGQVRGGFPAPTDQLNRPFETPGTLSAPMMAAWDPVPARYALRNATTVRSITGPHGLPKSTWGAP